MRKIYLVAFLLLISNIRVFAVGTYALISGRVAKVKNGGYVTLKVNKYGYTFNEPLFGFKTYKSQIVNNHFKFKVSINNTPLYAELHFEMNGQTVPLNGYLIENTDSVFIEVNGNNFNFHGHGSEKFNIIYKLGKIRDNYFKGLGEDLLEPKGLKNVFKKTELIGTHQLEYLNIKRQSLNNVTFTLIKAEILGMLYGEESSLYYYNYYALNDSLKNIAIKSVFNYHHQLPLSLMDNLNFNKDSILKYSGIYSTSFILKYQLDSCYLAGKSFEIKDCYQFILKNYSGNLRERIITNLLYHYTGAGQDISNLVNDALLLIKDKYLFDLLKKIKTSRVKGATAYNFNLIDTSGIVHKLSDYKGKVVLIDFWYTGCGNCIKICPYLKKVETFFINKPVVFLSVSVDRDKSKWIQSIKSGKYNSDAVINLFTDGLELKHPICLHYDITAFPTLILIDKSGNLMQNPIDPRTDNGENLLKLIKEEI